MTQLAKYQIMNTFSIMLLKFELLFPIQPHILGICYINMSLPGPSVYINVLFLLYPNNHKLNGLKPNVLY